jgi:hypothetical protein
MIKPLNTTKTTIGNLDLYSFSFPIDTLKKNIELLDLTILLKTQHLTYEFILEYVLNEKYQTTPEEKTIDIHDVVHNQPHIDMSELKRRLRQK